MVSDDDYINDAEDENTLTISGTSVGLAFGTTITVAVDGSGTDISGKTDTTDSDGDWSVSLTSYEVKALDESTPDADGEDLTITATATGASSGTRTVSYDPTAPDISSVAVTGTTLTVTMDESVYAATTPDNDNFDITGGGAPSVSGISGLPTTVAGADNSFTLTIASALTGGSPTLAYTQDSSDAKIIKDKAGNKLANLTGQAIAPPPTAPTLALQSPASSPSNDSTPTIRVTVDTNQQNGTVELFSDSGCATSISSSVTVDAATEDVTTTTLTEANSPYTIYAKHTNSSNVSTCSTTSVSYTYDGTAPTISSAYYNGTTITLTMSESVAVSGTKTGGDFTITGGGAPTVSSYTISGSTVTLTLSVAIPSDSTVTLAYAKNSTAANRIKDTVGNELAAISSQSVEEKGVFISAVSDDDYINATEDNSAILIAGTSNDIASNTTVTITLDDADADTNADHTFTATTNASGAWTTASTDLTATRIQNLDEGAMTITATAGAFSDTRTVVYDVTAPTGAVASVSDGYINATEDDGDVTITAVTNGDTASMAFSVQGGDTLTKTGTKGGFAYREKLSATIGTDDLDASDQFGSAIALNGNVFAVGARQDDDGATNAGAVYLLTDHDNDNDWTDSGTIVKKLHTTIGSHTLGLYDFFGSAVSLNGNILAVGAYFDDDGASNAGAVYLLTDHDNDNDWTDSGTIVKKLHTTIGTGNTLGENDYFGTAVALDGNVLAVSAYGDDDGATNAGAVYLLTDHDNDNDWTDTGTVVKKLHTTIGTGNTLGASDFFGSAVSLNGNILAVGAYFDDDGASNAGAVYLLTDHDNDNDWTDTGTVVKKLHTTIGTGNTLGENDDFGSAVSLNGDTLAVGAWRDDDGATNAGAVYLLTDHDNDNDWTDSGTTVSKFSTTIGTHTLGVTDYFGSAIALSDNILAVGAQQDDDGATNAGAVYLLRPSFTATLATGDFEQDGDPTDDDSKLAAGTVTITATPTDTAGNIGTGATGTTVYDPVLPTISTAIYGGTTIILTMSEQVAVSGTKTGGDFTVDVSGANNPTVSSYAISDSTVTLTLSAAIAAGSTVTLAYTQNGTEANRIKDTAGNELAAVTSKSVDEVSVSISAVSDDDYINATDDNSAILIAGTSTGLAASTNITITLDDADADTDADHTFTVTTNNDGTWTTASTDLTATRIQALEEGAMTITASADGAVSGTRTVTYDTTVPTISTATYSGTIITLTMSEDVAVSGTKTGSDFTITGGGAPTVSSYTISDSTVTMVLSEAITTGSTVTLAYAKNSTAENRITDIAGNELAAVSSKDVDEASVSVSVVSGDDYINDAEDENALIISGTSVGLVSGTTITVGVDGSGTDISGKTGTTDSDGDWSVSLTSAEVKVLDASSPDADGEDLTITATATGAVTGTRTVSYDPTAPDISSVAVTGTTLTVTMDESVYAATTPDNEDFSFSSGSQTVSSIGGLASTVATADNSFTLTISAALSGSPTLAYDQNDTDTKIIKDKAGNKLANLTGQAIAPPPTAPTLALQSPASSPGNDSTPTIRVTVDTNQQNGTVELFSDSGCATSISSSVTVDAATEDVDTTALTEGVHTIYAKHTNTSNVSTCSTTSVSYTYDGTAPTITTGTLDLASGDDTGTNTDNITKKTTGLTISGTLSAAGASGDYVQLYSNGTKIAGATDTTLGNTAWGIDIGLTEGTHPITAKVLDAAGNEGTASTALTIVVDTTAPAATYTTTTTGGTTSGSTTYLNENDTVSVRIAFPESIASTAPTVQYKNNTTNLGSAITSARDGTLAVALSNSAGDSAGTADALDFGAPSSVLTREAVSNGGFVYKVTAAQSSLYIGVSGDATTGVGLKGKWSATKPTSSQISDSTFGTEFISVGSRGADATLYAGKQFSNVTAGTYFWFYPTAIRTVTNREMTVITGISSGRVTDFASGTLAAADAAGTDDPIDFGAVSAAGVTREVLDSGYVYKTTKAYRRLSIGTDVTLSAGGAYAARQATSKPTTANLSTHGTQLWSRAALANSAISGGAVLKDVPAGTYFWVYPSVSANATNRTLELRGTDAIVNNPIFTATHTVGSSDTVAVGNLKYDITNETSVTDVAGNTLAAKAATTIANTAIDTTVPTISSAHYNGTTITLTMSESVAVSGTKTGGDFTITGGGAPTVSSYTISGSTVTLTLSSAITAGSTVTLAYAKNSTAANRIKDAAGNELAAVTAQSVTSKHVSISTVSTDDYINDAEDESALTISGTSSGLASGTTITVGVDGSGTDISGKTGTTNASGAWSVSLTSAEVKALDASTPAAGGEDLTITATSTGAASGTRTVTYDPTAPTVSSSNTGYYSDSSLGTELSGSVNAGTDIYTKVTFSEVIGKTVSDTSTARPVISYSLAGTDTQYDIIASGTPASGDCVESGTGNADGKQYSCRYTVASGNTGSFGVKVGTGSTDLAGNTLANTYTHSATLTADTTVPTISSAYYNGTTIVLTMSESVAVSGTKTGGDFTITGGGAPTVSSYTISGSTVTLTLSAAITAGSTVTLAYAKNSTAANRIKDAAGNELAAVTSKSVNSKHVSISAVSTDDYINNAEDESAITISGTSANLTTGTTITVGVDGSGTDISGKTGTTNASGAWSVSLTSAEVKALDAATPDADGEDLTITATSTGAASGTRTVTYDPTAPDISTVAASDTTLTVTMDESVYATTTPDNGDFSFSSGSQTVSSIGGLASTVATADNSFTLTVSAVLYGSPTLGYTQNGTDAKIIKDKAGNKLATVTGKTISGIVNAPSAPTLALQSPSSSPGNDSTPTIRVTVDTNQQNGTVQLYSDSSCSSSISSSVTVDAATEDVTTTTLTEANSPYTIYAKHTNSLSQSTCSTTNVSYTYDGTTPTISTALYNSTTITLTMSESVAVSGTKTGGDFTITGGGAPTVSSYTISGSTVTLTLSAAITAGSTVTLAYAKNSTAANRIKDAAGNELAAVTAQSVTSKHVSISTVSTDDYINDAEDESALTISGTSSGLASGTTITVGVDGSGTDISGKTGTTNASGAWSVSLTSAEVKALDASTPAAGGEDLTITATSTGAASGTRTVTYDPTAPTVSSSNTGYYSDSSLGTELSGSVNAGTDIYTKVTFSEVIGKTVSDTSTARPVISYSLAGTDTQYDIIASGTPASGDCVESGTGNADGKQYSCRYTVASGNTGSFGVKVGTSTADPAGNALANTYTHSATLTADTTSPTISTALYNSTTITLTMSESVAVSGTKTGGDFTVSVTGASNPTISSYTISGSTVTLTLSSAITAGSTVTLAYAKNSTAANRIKDAAGNELAAVTAQSVTSKHVSISTVSTDDYINDAEDESAITISGTSSGLASGTTITVGVDGSGTDISGKTDTTNASGAWSVSLTSAEVKALDASTPAAGGEDLTITATSTGAASGTRTVTYDPAVPTISSAHYNGTTITLTMSESVAVSGTKTGGDFTITGGGAPTVSSYTISGSTVTLTLSAAITAGSTVTLAYAKNSTAANRIKDAAGNELAAVTAQSVTSKHVSISTVSTDDYINDAEDESALTISGTSSGLASGTTITVGVDGSGTDISGKTDTTNASGAWSVSLTSAEVKALDASTPAAGGEDLTITATSTGAASGTRTVSYDVVAPTVSSSNTGYYSDSSLGTELSGSVNAGTDIYTKVTFSEVIGKTVSDTSTARPVISYSLAGTDTQYDIIASGTPASGDCVESGTGNADGKQYSCRYTVASGNTGSFGVKVGTSTADPAGNALANTYTHSATLTADTTSPTISSVSVVGTTVTVVMSEDVYAATTPDNADFAIVGGGAPTISSINGLPTTVATAGNSFTMPLSSAFTSGSPSLSYTQNSADSKRIKDVAGNALATVSSYAIGGNAVLVSAISDGYLNATEGASPLTVNGTSVGLGTGTTVTVIFDDSDADTTADITKTSTTNSSGAWQVILTVAEIAALEQGIVTATVSASNAASGAKSFVYDSVSPTISIGVVEEDGYVNSTEDDGGITIAGTTVGADSGSDVDVVVSRGTQTVSIDDLSVSSNTWTTPLSLANLTALGEGTITITATVDDTAGNTTTTTASFIYDSTAPTVVVTGAPTDRSNVTTLSVSVAGSTVTHYKHKIVTDSSCTTGSYGSEVSVTTRITDTVTIADGAVTLCVIGSDIAGNWQSPATTASWIKDTTPPTNSAGSISGPPSVKIKRDVSFTGTTDTTAVLAGDYVAIYAGATEVARSDAFAVAAAGAVDWEVSFSSSTLGKGTYTLTAYYYDAAGNRTTDATPPTASISVRSSGGYFAGGGRGRSNFGTVTARVFDGGVPSQTLSELQRLIPTRTYIQGERHGFILQSQQKLNKTENCKVAASSFGSAGQETDYLGSLTSAALLCYQQANGLTATGTLTPETYAHLLGLPFVAQEPTPTRAHIRGERHDFIFRAQQALNKTENCKVATSSFGSAGQETDYLGSLTSAALLCHQQTNGLTATGTLTPETYEHLLGPSQQNVFVQEQDTFVQEPVTRAEVSSGLLDSLLEKLSDMRERLAALLNKKKQEGASTGESGQPAEGQQQEQQESDGSKDVVDDGVSATISKTYQPGDSDPEIRDAQILLNRTYCRLATVGAGSPGNETNSFGPKLRAAIICYQTLRGLPTTGILTPELYNSIYLEVGESASSLYFYKSFTSEYHDLLGGFSVRLILEFA